MPDSNRRHLLGRQRSLANWTNDANLGLTMLTLDPAENDDRTEWDRAWSSMPHRRILDTTKVDFVEMSGLEVGEVVTVTISEAPKEYFEKLYISIPVCPICGRSADDDSERVGVNVSPVYTKLSNLGFGALAHQKCLSECPLIDEPTPVPW